MNNSTHSDSNENIRNLIFDKGSTYMGALIVIPIIAFILTYWLNRNLQGNLRVLSAGSAAFVAILCTSLLDLAILSVVPSKRVVSEYNRAKIVALSTAVSAEGSFFLASGRIEGKMYYYFYFETSNKGKRITKLPAENVTIYEEDRKDAYYTENAIMRKSSGRGWLFNFFVPDFFASIREGPTSYDIHLPKGSIKQEIDASLPH